MQNVITISFCYSLIYEKYIMCIQFFVIEKTPGINCISLFCANVEMLLEHVISTVGTKYCLFIVVEIYQINNYLLR